MELDSTSTHSLLMMAILYLVWRNREVCLDGAVLILWEIGDMLTLLDESHTLLVLVLEHLVLLMLELRMWLHVLALHRLL